MINNLFFIMVDDLRADYQEIANNEAIYFKKFADRGLVFKNLFVHAPETYLSGGTFMTGLYPSNHKSGLEPWVKDPKEAWDLTYKGKKTVYAYLKDSHTPFIQGLFGPFGGSINANDWKRLGWMTNAKFTVKVRPNAWPSIEFLQRHKNPQQHTNVYLQFWTLREIDKIMHARIDQTCEKGDVKKLMGAYKEAILQVDTALGEIWDYFERHRVFDNTVIIITADHGESFKLHDNHILGETGAAWCLHNGSRYDEALRIPFTLIAPNLKPGVVEAQCRQIDMMPTFMQLLGVETANTDGVALDVRHPENIKSKDVFSGMTTETKKQSIRTTEGWKMIFDGEGIELYNIKEDPKEQTNLASKKKDKVKELFELIKDLPKGLVYSPETIFFRYSDYKNFEYVEKLFKQLHLDEEWRGRSDKYNEISWVNDHLYLEEISNMMDIRGQERILDVGCGTGIILEYLHKKNSTLRLFGVDSSPSMIRKVKNASFDLRVASATCLPFPEKSFNVVYARMILHHLKGFLLKEAFQEMKRVTSNIMLIAESVPINDGLINDFKYFLNGKEDREYLTSEDIEKLFKRYGFRNIRKRDVILKSQSINNWLDNTNTSEDIRQEIIKRHHEVSDEYKKAANFQFLKDDILSDMRHVIIAGEKT